MLNNAVLDVINNRSSVRAFSDKAIEAGKKDAILNSAFRSPTAGAQMLYTILDITDQEVKDKLAVSCDDQPFIAKAPLVLIFLADYQRQYDYYLASGAEDLCQLGGREMRLPGEGDFLLAANDAIIAAQSTVIAAESLGIASCYIGDILEKYEFHKALFDLPEYTFPVTMLCFGYPKGAYPRKKQVPRYEPEYILHQNTYRRFEPGKLAGMTLPLEEMGPVHYLGQAENYGQHTFLRKFDTDFSREMTRSVRKALENWSR
ncbi:MAG: nitroreductase family protein [Spirochaetales bacterium]|nr:nitroreductase family protein [Spirochaetales bacterium]